MIQCDSMSHERVSPFKRLQASVKPVPAQRSISGNRGVSQLEGEVSKILLAKNGTRARVRPTWLAKANLR